MAVETLDTAETAPKARVCREAGCTTILSQYNSTAWCGLHSRRDWRANREPRRRTATPVVQTTSTVLAASLNVVGTSVAARFSMGMLGVPPLAGVFGTEDGVVM